MQNKVNIQIKLDNFLWTHEERVKEPCEELDRQIRLVVGMLANIVNQISDLENILN